MTSPNLTDLTRAYIAAFDACDLNGVAELLDPEMRLTDPGVRNLGPKGEVLAFIENLFSSVDNTLSFKARSILADGSQSVIEFELTLGSKSFEGVDVIDWTDDGKIRELRAHLTEV